MRSAQINECNKKICTENIVLIVKPSKADITLAEAGLAGMAPAIVLTGAGYRVSIHEQRSRVSGRFHDDYQGLENWSHADDMLTKISDAGIELNRWYKPFHGGPLYGPRLRPINITSPQPLFYMVRRVAEHGGSLDLALQRQGCPRSTQK